MSKLVSHMVRIVSFDEAVEEIGRLLDTVRGDGDAAGKATRATRALVLCGPPGCGKSHAVRTATARTSHEGTVVYGVEARGCRAGERAASKLALGQARSLRGRLRYACIEAADAADSKGAGACVGALREELRRCGRHRQRLAPLIVLCNSSTCPLVKHLTRQQGSAAAGARSRASTATRAVRFPVEVLWQRPLPRGRMAAIIRSVAPLPALRSADIDRVLTEADGDLSSAAMSVALQLRAPVVTGGRRWGSASMRKDQSAGTRSPWMALATFLLADDGNRGDAQAQQGQASATMRALGGPAPAASWLHENVAGLAALGDAPSAARAAGSWCNCWELQLVDVCDSISACDACARRGHRGGAAAAEACALHALHASRRYLDYRAERGDGSDAPFRASRQLSRSIRAPRSSLSLATAPQRARSTQSLVALNPRRPSARSSGDAGYW